jgi:hypothetical protein
VVSGERSWTGWRSLLGLAMVAAAGSAVAQQADSRVTTLDHAIEVYLSDDALQAQYVRQSNFGDIGPTELRGGFFYNEDRDLIGIADLLVHIGDEVDVRSFEVRVGARAYAAFLAPEDQDVFGIGLGGEAQYFLGSARNSSITLSLFYSADIVTFGTADNVKDASLRFTTRLRSGTDIFVGVRTFEFDLPEDREVDDNVHIGLRHSF